MSEQKNQQKQPPKRATSGIFAILMALLLFILGQQGILPLGDTADAPDALPTETIAAVLTDSPTSAPTATPVRTEKPTATPTDAPKQTAITAPQDIADYIFAHGTLPDNFLTKNEARQLGWDSSKNYVSDVAPGYSIGGDRFGNYEGLAAGCVRAQVVRGGRELHGRAARRRANPLLVGRAGVLHERPLPDVHGNAPVGEIKRATSFG